jgi:ATP adenylyltransferase
MEYIAGPKAPRCIFCDFASAPPAEYREKLVLVVNDHALVCLNRFPVASSHLLVAPRRHVSDLSDLPAGSTTS